MPNTQKKPTKLSLASQEILEGGPKKPQPPPPPRQPPQIPSFFPYPCPPYVFPGPPNWWSNPAIDQAESSSMPLNPDDFWGLAFRRSHTPHKPPPASTQRDGDGAVLDPRLNASPSISPSRRRSPSTSLSLPDSSGAANRLRETAMTSSTLEDKYIEPHEHNEVTENALDNNEVFDLNAERDEEWPPIGTAHFLSISRWVFLV